MSRQIREEKGEAMEGTGSAENPDVNARLGVENRRGIRGMRRAVTAIHGGPKGELRTNPTGKRGAGEKGARRLTGGATCRRERRGKIWEPSDSDRTVQEGGAARLLGSRPISIGRCPRGKRAGRSWASRRRWAGARE